MRFRRNLALDKCDNGTFQAVLWNAVDEYAVSIQDVLSYKYSTDAYFTTK